MPLPPPPRFRLLLLPLQVGNSLSSPLVAKALSRSPFLFSKKECSSPGFASLFFSAGILFRVPPWPPPKMSRACFFFAQMKPVRPPQRSSFFKCVLSPLRQPNASLLLLPVEEVVNSPILPIDEKRTRLLFPLSGVHFLSPEIAHFSGPLVKVICPSSSEAPDGRPFFP